ncbi:Ig-like domain-containing protein [Capnocytophaga sp. ARDL2]|uniref:Ig-like domain-containing protein n=1 Tax=Capnocytophaga sp. ARDL2 TaxID=3238809 RepID=UPI00355791C5
MKNLRQLLFLVIICISLFFSCAKRGYITGGPQDTLPPVLLKAIPENFSTQFNEKTIKLSFDEYVKLNNVNQQLIISPPMEQMPELSPMGLANKTVTIKLKDSLKSNTTYSFNFGNSIVDNNEGNAFEAFKYVFSTGKFIDSLQVNVQLRDAFEPTLNQGVKVMLYEAENFKDSLIFKKKPYYVAHAAKGQTSATLENIKAGEYVLFALTDDNNNYTFQPKLEKIAFLSHSISVPTDSIFVLTLFKEQPQNNISRPSMLSKNKWLVPFEGEYKNITIEVSDFEKKIPSAFYKVADKDSLHVFMPEIAKDSLKFSFTNGDYTKEYVLKPRNVKTIDTLNVSFRTGSVLHFRDSLQISSTTPIVQFDKEKIQLTDDKENETIFDIVQDKLKNILYLIFDKKENTSYKLQLYPGAVTDLFQKSNDSLRWEGKTTSYADYANLTVTVEHTEEVPLIFELLNDKNKVVQKQIVPENKQLVFQRLEPGKYQARVIIDANVNGKWDSGNYLEKRQSETIVNLPVIWDARANWELNETVRVGD